jgi:hypothetical protein
MPPRAPLPVEVVTKIPVNLGGLGLADPGITGGITRSAPASVAQGAAGRATVEIVTQVPGTLRNITPVTLGQRLGAAAKIGVGIGSKVVGVGLGVLGNLAQDLLFPDPVGLGSDMVGGVKIGSQTQPKPQLQTQPKPQLQTQPKPQLQTQPKPQLQTQPKPQLQTQPKPQLQTQPKPQLQTQPKPQLQTQPKPQLQTQPKPLSVNLPQPRASLDTPLPQGFQPISPDSPYPLNFVDLNSYGGVNLTYPIAQKLIEFDFRLDEMQRKLEELQYWPQSFENTLKTAKIETIVNLPAQIDFTSQIPVAIDLRKEIPVNVNLNSQLPINLDIASQLPVKTDLFSELPLNVAFASQLPFALDLSNQIPISVDLRKEIPLAMNLFSQLPIGFNLIKEVPVNIDLASQLPINLDISSQLPVNIDLRKEVPLALDLSAILQPDDAASGLKSLKECCESIQTTLKKKEEIFEGTGQFICNNESVPYLYRGAGLNGIHQLIKIVLNANEQILEKICTLEVSDPQDSLPLIHGSGVYDCGTLPVPYIYSGVGLLGIQNQIDQLFKLDKHILTEVCQTNSTPFGSLPFPEISGKIEYFGCDYATQAILYSGNGLEGLHQQINALTEVVKVGVKASCDSGGVAIMPDARYEQFRASGQLAITWGTQYPTQQGSLWHSYIPNPNNELNFNWCEHFEQLTITKGNIYGSLEWENSKVPTGIYGNSIEEITQLLLYFASLSKSPATLNQLGQPKVVIITGNSSKRNIQENTLRAVRVVISEIGEDGNVSSLKCFTPPPEGCLPSII